jgi:hypothetical protein
MVLTVCRIAQALHTPHRPDHEAVAVALDAVSAVRVEVNMPLEPANVYEPSAEKTYNCLALPLSKASQVPTTCRGTRGFVLVRVSVGFGEGVAVTVGVGTVVGVAGLSRNSVGVGTVTTFRSPYCERLNGRRPIRAIPRVRAVAAASYRRAYFFVIRLLRSGLS